MAARPAHIAGLLLVSALLLVGCKTHYTADTHPGEAEAARSDINEALRKNQHIVLITEDQAFHVRRALVSDEALDAVIGDVPAAAEPLARPPEDRPAEETAPTNWMQTTHRPTMRGVRIHLKPGVRLQPGEVSVAFSDIAQIDVFSVDTGRTTASYVVGTLGVTAGVVVLLGVLIAATKDSCPFVYTFDGEGYRLAGEAFGGAIAAPLERSDYLPLKDLASVDGYYRLRLANELKEREYINLTQLLAVSHPTGTSVLVDKYGVVHTTASPQTPLQARATEGASHDYTGQVVAADQYPFTFTAGHGDTSALVLTFARPDAATRGKLIVHAKASYWLEHVFDRYTAQFGALYGRWEERLATRSAEELERWALGQSLPLKVYLETPSGWQYVDHFDMVGPLAGAREMVLPIDLSAAAGDAVRVKIETGYAFWELDAAAMDYSADQPVRVEVLQPARATTLTGADATPLLAADDDRYLEQFEVGDAVDLSFRAPAPEDGRARTVVLHAKGYYEPIREYEGMPDLLQLFSFREDGRFTAFAKEQFHLHTAGLGVAATSPTTSTY